MISPAAIFAFAVAVSPLVLTPGASFTLVTARGLAGDRRGVWLAILGTGCGIVLHAFLAGVGLAAVVLRSAELYRSIGIVGALFLIGLGLSLLCKAYRGSSPDEAVVEGAPTGSAWGQWCQAFIANVLNVKAATIYLTLAPQFVSAADVGVVSMLVLASAHLIVMTLWLGLWSAGLAQMSHRIDPRRWTRRIAGAGGGVLVALGARSAIGAR